MIKPEGVANVLQTKLHAIDTDYEPIGEGGEKLFAYHLDFDSYKTFALLKQQTQDAAGLVELDLLIERIEPVIHYEGNTVEARIRVTVEETVNRHEIENRKLEEFHG